MPNNEGFGKIAVGLRYNKPCAMFMDSWTKMIQTGLEPGDVVMPVCADLPHHFAAETLVYQFLHNTNCDTLLMVDDDHGFGADTLHRLRSNVVNHSYGVVGALYATRRPEYRPLIMCWDKKSGDYSHYTPTIPRGTMTCDIVGLGFTLIRREAIMAVKKQRPGEMLFYWPSDSDGEDVTFCKLVAQEGYKIGVDTTVCIAHQITALVGCSPNSAEVTLEGDVNMNFGRMLSGLKTEQKQMAAARMKRQQAKQEK